MMAPEVNYVEVVWHGEATNVLFAGEFSNWEGLSMTRVEDTTWKIKLLLKLGEHSCKFIVDETWETSDELEIVTAESGILNNILRVTYEESLDDSEQGKPMSNLDEEEILFTERQQTVLVGEAEKTNHREAPGIGAIELVAAQTETHNVILRYSGNGSIVQVAGTFSNWEGLTMTQDESNNWSIRLMLKNGSHDMHFIVDGLSTLSEGLNKKVGPAGEVINVIEVGQKEGIQETEATVQEVQIKDKEDQGKAVLNELFEIIETQDETSDIVLRYTGAGKEVQVAGSFSNWEGLTMRQEGSNSWIIQLKVRNGPHNFHFLVDGVTTISENLDQDAEAGSEASNLIMVGSEANSTNDSKATITNKMPEVNDSIATVLIPLIRSEEEQLNVFLGTDDGIYSTEDIVPFIRNEAEQINVFLGTSASESTDDNDPSSGSEEQLHVFSKNGENKESSGANEPDDDWILLEPETIKYEELENLEQQEVLKNTFSGTLSSDVVGGTEKLASEVAKVARQAAKDFASIHNAAEAAGKQAEAKAARIAAEEAEAAKKEAETEVARIVAEEAEATRIAAEEAKAARMEAEADAAKIAAEEAEAAKMHAESEAIRIAAEKAEAAREAAKEAEAAEKEALAEAERIEAMETETARKLAETEAARIAAEEAEATRNHAEVEAIRIAEVAAARIEAEEAEAVRKHTEAEAARIEAEEAEATRVAADEAEAARKEAEAAAAEAEAARRHAEAESARVAVEEAEVAMRAEKEADAARKEAEAAKIAKEEAEAAKKQAEAEAARIAAKEAEAAKIAKEEAEAAEAEVARIVAEEAESARIAAEEAEEARKHAEAETIRIAAEKAEAARVEAEEVARKKAEAEAARIATEEAEAAKELAEAEAIRIAEEKAEEARVAAEKAEAARKEAEAEAVKLAAEEAETARKLAEAEAARIAAEEAEVARIAEEEASKKEAEAAASKLAEEEAETARKFAETEAARKAAEEAEVTRVAAEGAEAVRKEAEAAVAMIAAEEAEAARKDAEAELARVAAEETEVARVAAEEAEAARTEAGAEAAKKAKEEAEIARRQAEAEAARIAAEVAEAARKYAEAEAARVAAEVADAARKLVQAEAARIAVDEARRAKEIGIESAKGEPDKLVMKAWTEAQAARRAAEDSESTAAQKMKDDIEEASNISMDIVCVKMKKAQEHSKELLKAEEKLLAAKVFENADKQVVQEAMVGLTEIQDVSSKVQVNNNGVDKTVEKVAKSVEESVMAKVSTELENGKKITESEIDKDTKAAIEKAKTAAEETIGKFEAALGRKEASGDAANNNGTFVELDMENGNLLDNAPARRGMKRFLRCFQCTVL